MRFSNFSSLILLLSLYSKQKDYNDNYQKTCMSYTYGDTYKSFSSRIPTLFNAWHDAGLFKNSD